MRFVRSHRIYYVVQVAILRFAEKLQHAPIELIRFFSLFSVVFSLSGFDFFSMFLPLSNNFEYVSVSGGFSRNIESAHMPHSNDDNYGNGGDDGGDQHRFTMTKLTDGMRSVCLWLLFCVAVCI